MARGRRSVGDRDSMCGNLGERVPPRLLRYVARFDRGEFWLAHEELEEHWQAHRHDAFKGLIQVAAGFLHIERQNWRGARRLLSTALGYLSDTPARFEGFDIETIRAKTADVLAHVSLLADGEATAFDDALRFRIAPLFAAEVPGGVVEDMELPYRVRRYDDGYSPLGGRGGRGGRRGRGGS